MEATATNNMDWLNAKRCWVLGLLVTLIVIAWRLTFLEAYGKVWIDEAMVADFYRIAFDETRLGCAANYPDGSPRLPPIPWGVIYEASLLKPFGVSMTTVRILGLISGLSMGFSFAWLLRTLGCSMPVATLLAIALSFEGPLFRSWALCRIDATAIAAANVGLVCWLRAGRGMGRQTLLAGLAGFFAAMAPLIWPTSISTVAGYAVIAGFRSGESRQQTGRAVAAAIGGGLLCLLIGVLLVYPQLGWQHLLIDLEYHLGWATGVVTISQKPQGPASILRGLRDIAYQGLGVLALIGTLPFALRSSARTVLPWLAPLAVALVPCLAIQPPHVYRAVYVLPLVFITIAILAERTLPRFGFRLCVLVCVLNFSVCLVSRTADGMLHWHGRDYDAYENAMTAIIPDGAVVFDGTYTAYYMSLRHGWHYYAQHFPPFLKEPTEGPVYIITNSPEKYSDDDFEVIEQIGETPRETRDYGSYLLRKLPARLARF